MLLGLLGLELSDREGTRTGTLQVRASISARTYPFWSKCVPLVLNKRRTPARPDPGPSVRRGSTVVAFPNVKSISQHPLDRLVIFLAKKAAMEDHLVSLEED